MKNKLILSIILIFLFACSRNNEGSQLVPIEYKYVEGEIEVLFTPLKTKNTDERIHSFIMEADDDAGIHISSIVVANIISSTCTQLEQYTDGGVFIGSLLIQGDKITQVQYNTDIVDADMGAPATKGVFTKCVGEKYRTLSDIIDSDGESRILCDGTNIFQLCNAAKLVASAIICIRDGK